MSTKSERQREREQRAADLNWHSVSVISAQKFCICCDATRKRCAATVEVVSCLEKSIDIHHILLRTMNNGEWRNLASRHAWLEKEQSRA